MKRPSRRRLLAVLGTGVVGSVAGCGRQPPADTATEPAQTPPTGSVTTTTPPRPASVGLSTVVAGLQAPVAMASLPDTDQRYVLEQSGLVLTHGPDGLAETPALDLRDAVVAGGERGLLGIAIHPDFARNRRVYLRYSAPRRAGTPRDYSHTFVLSEFRASADGRRLRPATERTLLEIPEPQGNHNAGDLAFGPGGYLHVAVGDGGAGGDTGEGHVEDWYDGLGGGNGQDVTANLLGSLLRLDVDERTAEMPYGIPDDNPLLGREGLDEHYAWGFRNPWRLSFDGNDLYVADVGQNRYEEVNRVERGGNYGWNVREGAHCFNAADCPTRTPDGEALIDPIIEYPHGDAPVSGISVIGGYVYRGEAVAGLAGSYVFGDLAANGRLFVATPPADGRGRWDTAVLPVAEDDAPKLGRLFSFARDADGELYALGVGRPGGGIHRLVAAR